MTVDLEKIDVIRERLGASYEEAKKALEGANGDLVEALVILERQQKEKTADIITLTTQLIEEIEKTLNKGEIKKVRFKLGERTIKELPVSLGVAGTLFVSLLSVLLKKSQIELEQKPKHPSGGEE